MYVHTHYIYNVLGCGGSSSSLCPSAGLLWDLGVRYHY